MNIDKAARRLLEASSRGCTIPYGAKEFVLKEIKKELIKILEEENKSGKQRVTGNEF